MKYRVDFTQKHAIFNAYRIIALKDFSDVKTGDVGGYVLNTANLSHLGDCWIYDNAVAMERSTIYDNAVLQDFAIADEDSSVRDNAKVYGHAIVSNRSDVSGWARVGEFASVKDSSMVYGNASIHGRGSVRGSSNVYENAMVYEDGVVEGSARVFGDSEIFGYMRIGGTTICNGMHYLVMNNLLPMQVNSTPPPIPPTRQRMATFNPFGSAKPLRHSGNGVSHYEEKKCTCGAKHTSMPNHHLHFCDINGDKK